MNTTHRRIALLTGASISTLGVAGPALAAINPGTQHVVVAPSVTDTITLCGVGSTCDYGVDNIGPGPAIITEGGRKAGKSGAQRNAIPVSI